MKINRLKLIHATIVLALIFIVILNCNIIDYSQIRLIKKDNGLYFTPVNIFH